MSELRCAVVGVGYLGRFHAQKYKASTKAKLVGVYDKSPEQAKKVADELGVDVFNSIQDMVGEVDAVTIAATTTAHYELSQFFLKNNIHVNVEKPITSLSSQAEELCRLADEKKLVLQVGHVERFNPALIAVKEKLKDPLYIECHRLAPYKPRGVDVDVVLDLMIHDIDLILSLVKSKPVSVAAIGTSILTDTTDIANARIEFESGAVANITASRVSETAQRKLRVFLKDQYLSIDFGEGQIGLVDKVTVDGKVSMEKQSWSLEKEDALQKETDAFIQAVLGESECLVPGIDGLNAIKLAEQVIETIKQKQF